MLDLWLKILDIMDRLMNSGQGDNLEEAVPESLKNILLVMADGGFLVPLTQGSRPSELWIETCKRVDRFLPGLIPELFPQASAVPVESKPAVEKASAPPAPTVIDASETDAKEPTEEAQQPNETPAVETKAEDVD